jgi:predicted metal-dependent hydrolase
MDARLRDGVKLFNEGRFFESHEVWETLYRDTEEQHKPFVEGLIQLSAACRMIADFGETKGPVKLIYQALIRFESYQPVYMDVKVADLTRTMEAWAKKLEAGGDPDPTAVPTIPLRRFIFF